MVQVSTNQVGGAWRTDLAQQQRSFVARQTTAHLTGQQVGKQHMQSVEALGAASDHVLAPVAQQPQRFVHAIRLANDSHAWSGVGTCGADRGDVGLGATPSRQQPYTSTESERYVEHRLTGIQHGVAETSAQAVRVFDGPAAVGPSGGPALLTAPRHGILARDYRARLAGFGTSRPCRRAAPHRAGQRCLLAPRVLAAVRHHRSTTQRSVTASAARCRGVGAQLAPCGDARTPRNGEAARLF